jgi:hypothetical protein
MTGPEKAALRAEALERFGRLFDERIEGRSLTLDEIEAVVEEIGREMESWLEEELIKRQEPHQQNQAACPDCRQNARYRHTLATKLLTTHGYRAIPRRYHYCPRCEKGFSPIDAVLALEAGRDASRQVRAWQARYGSEGSFGSVPELLRELRGIDVSASTVERTTVEIGEAVYEEMRRQETEPDAAHRGQSGLADAQGVTPERVYVSFDGTFIPLREHWKKDGSMGKLVCRGGEVKLGMIFTTDRKDGLDTEVKARACVATLAGIDAFTPLMSGLGKRAEIAAIPLKIVLGDGAQWIWNLAARQFPGAIQILDYFHMTQHLNEVAKAMFPQDAGEARQWVRKSEACFLRDVGCMVISEIRAWKPKTKEGRELRERELGYFQENAQRMRYKTFLDKGYTIGSGVIESGCRQVVGQRLDQAGMHWRQGTAQAVLAIRAHLRSAWATDLRGYA